MPEINDGKYKTADLYYAAYLMTAQVEFTGVEEAASGRVVFVFTRPENIRDLKMQFFTHRARVSALTYANNIKTLKSIIHMETEGSGD